MDQGYFIRIIGPVLIDDIAKKAGRFFEFSAQHPSVVPFGPSAETSRVDYQGKVWSDDEAPKEGDVVHINAVLIPFAEPKIYVKNFAVLCRGELPSNFEAALPTVITLGQVTAWDTDTRACTLHTGEFNHWDSKRVTVDLIVYLNGKQFKNVPEPRIGSIMLASGAMYDQANVSAKWSIQADAVHYLPLTGAATGSNPGTPIKRRKYERKNVFKSTANDKDDGEVEGEASSSTTVPVTPFSGRSAGKTRANPVRE